MERKALESAAATYSYLRGLTALPLGLLMILAALGNWEVGPLRQAWVFVACALLIGAAYFPIARYYNDAYGRVTPSTSQQTRGAVAGGAGIAVMVAVSLLARSDVSWSLDLPVNPTAAAFALFLLVVYAITLGLRAHHVVIWGAVLAAGLLPLWGDVTLSDTSNIGLVLAGVAVLVCAGFDHRLFVRRFGAADVPGASVRA